MVNTLSTFVIVVPFNAPLFTECDHVTDCPSGSIPPPNVNIVGVVSVAKVYGPLYPVIVDNGSFETIIFVVVST